jgi:CRISPR/Cas system CSM-associated protein Csm3 (group 7 of RAMP superfamily)
MHKQLVNQCILDITIIPSGPILIKSGLEGADPTKPNMNFVETFHNGRPAIYLPGSSLKGAIRAHAERIVRTVGHPGYDKPSNSGLVWANNPLDDRPLDVRYDYLYEKSQAKEGLKKKLSAPEIYQNSSFTDQLFGSPFIASRLRIEDAYHDESKPLRIEQRNGVAIDRVFGSVAHGPFDYQVCTSGAFKTKIHLKNFSLPQLGLIALVLRDLDEGWFGIGYGKTRGLGTVMVEFNSAVVQYPGCILEKEGDVDKIYKIGSKTPWDKVYLAGAGEFLKENQENNSNPYGFPPDDKHEITIVKPTSMEYGFGVQIRWEGETEIKELFMHTVATWSKLLEEGGAICVS